MKKITSLVLFVFAAIFITAFSSTANTNTTLVIHYQNWSGEYEGLGAHGWGGAEEREAYTGEDEFGVYYEFENVPNNVELGFIAVSWNGDAGIWENAVKQTEDVLINTSKLEAGKVNHAYVFEGADSKNNDGAGMYLAKSDEFNMLLVYADPAGTYEENLGVHAWNDWSNAEDNWGSPDQVFTNGASNTAVPQIKVAMLHSKNIEAGLLIYVGGDENKKTGDVTLKAALESALPQGQEPVVGDVGFAYVYSKGDAYTANDNVGYEVGPFVEEAFSFRLLPLSFDASGLAIGTFAPNPNQVFVALSANVANIYQAAAEADKEAAKETINGWFTIREKDGAAIDVKSVDFSTQAETIKDFVVILDGEIDNSKEYEVEFNLGLEGDLNREAVLDLDLDSEAPVITFSSPSEIVGRPAEERIILVEWNKKFPANKFPSFIVNDNRDGDISHMAYVPAGSNSTVNTNELGDYTIMLRVEDRWGNVTEETFIFRVTKDMK